MRGIENRMKLKQKKERVSGWMHLKNDWKGMKLWQGNELCRLDWIISSIVLLILFLTCMQGDMRLTGNRSFLMYEHFTDFYKASYEQSGGYYANYLPSTFIAYAIWNLPLYLAGHIPEAILTNSFINNMWYKLLPVILYYVTAHFMYKIGMEAGFGEKKSRLCKFAFLVFPIGVFSQFIFSQYDIFTVFFMVLGLYYFLKGKMWRFALLFGVATTFKYHAVLYFLVLLVLKEKKIRDILKYTLVMFLPVLVEVLPNINSIHFQRHVMGFGALKFVQKQFSFGFFNGFNLVAVAAAFVLVWAYQRKTRDEEDLFSWASFLTTAMSFAIFGFASWNPQWLLLLVPFLLLNIFINENGNMLVMITNIFMLALYIFSSQSMVGENVLNCGILKYILLSSEFAVRMWDVYKFHDEELLCSAMWVVLLVYVIFGQPKYHNRKGNTISTGLIWQIRSAFSFGVLAYVLPMMICVAAMFQGWMVFQDNSQWNLEPENTVTVENDDFIEQDIVADGSVLKDIRVRIYTGEQSITSLLGVELAEKETGEVVYSEKKYTDKFTKNSAIYSILDKEVSVEPGKTYTLKLSSEEEGKIGFYCVTNEETQEVLRETTEMPGEITAERQLQMKVIGMK